MSVESFDPSATGVALDQAAISRLLEAGSGLTGSELNADAATGDGLGDGLGLSTLEQSSMANLMTAPAADWQAAVESLSDTEIETLVRFLTLAEEAITGWQAGDKSPVIPLVKVLKARGNYDRSLTRWIKSNTNNRFLPHGSLMDRL